MIFGGIKSSPSQATLSISLSSSHSASSSKPSSSVPEEAWSSPPGSHVRTKGHMKGRCTQTPLKAFHSYSTEGRRIKPMTGRATQGQVDWEKHVWLRAGDVVSFMRVCKWSICVLDGFCVNSLSLESCRDSGLMGVGSLHERLKLLARRSAKADWVEGIRVITHTHQRSLCWFWWCTVVTYM